MTGDARGRSKPGLTVARLGAEVIGTFLVTATAIGIDVFYYTRGDIDYSSRWLARGLVVAAVTYSFSETSGAHANPAVTIGFFARRIFPGYLTAAYVAMQFLGAFAAAGLWLLMMGPALGLGTSHPGPHFSAVTAATAEAIATFALMLVILMTAQEEAAVGREAALAVGFMVAVCGFVVGPISGASMNPARTIAPQLLSGAYTSIWMYLVGPIVGSITAVGAHAMLCGPPSKGQRKAARGGGSS